jgi:hypothetical protein
LPEQGRLLIVLEDCVGFGIRFRKAIFCVILAGASMIGAPVRAEEMEELMRAKDKAKVVQTISGGTTPDEGCNE